MLLPPPGSLGAIFQSSFFFSHGSFDVASAPASQPINQVSEACVAPVLAAPTRPVLSGHGAGFSEEPVRLDRYLQNR